MPGASAFCTSIIASSVIRIAVRMQASSSGVLIALAAPTTAPASTGAPLGNNRFDARDIAPVHSSTAIDGPGWNQVGQHTREIRYTFVEFEIDRAVHVIGGQLRLLRGALAERQEQVRPFVVTDHHGHRPLDVGQAGVAERPAGAGGVDNGVVTQQDQRVDAAVGHRRPQPGPGLPAHPGKVGRFGNHRRGTRAPGRPRERRH